MTTPGENLSAARATRIRRLGWLLMVAGPIAAALTWQLAREDQATHSDSFLYGNQYQSDYDAKIDHLHLAAWCLLALGAVGLLLLLLTPKQGADPRRSYGGSTSESAIVGGNQGVPPNVATGQSTATPLPQASAPDPMAQLRQLGELRDTGVLSDAEFDVMKADILGRM